jgi:hypothetical protein
MQFSFKIEIVGKDAFLSHWEPKYKNRHGEKYTQNIGKPLTIHSRNDLFVWKNGTSLSRAKAASVDRNYPLIFEGDRRDQYLNHQKPGGAIWNIFYLHCLEPEKWPIFDQHTFRAMRYIKDGKIAEIGKTDKEKYAVYEYEYIPFVQSFKQPDYGKVDRALFTFGQFLKLAAKYA